MAFPLRLPSLPSLFPPLSPTSSYILLSPHYYNPINFSSLCLSPNKAHSISTSKHIHNSNSFHVSYRFSTIEQEDEDDDCSFDKAVELFNKREYYKCHDFLEALWNQAEEPTRTVVHGILQCAVGFHHLFNKNHKGAMMELGEGLCKLRKMNFESGPFHLFEQEISAALDFIYQTQLELAACTDDLCLAMDQTERSYQLLGGYAAGQDLYSLESDPNGILYIVFCPPRSYGSTQPPRVKLPILSATGASLGL